MGYVTEEFSEFPFHRTPTTLKRNEELMFSPAVPAPLGPQWDPIPPLATVWFDPVFKPGQFAPPRILFEGEGGRIEWQLMASFRQPMYHRNLDVDELAFQICGTRTLMTERGTATLTRGDFVRIPVGVVHDNLGIENTHILWYFPAPIVDTAPIVRRSEYRAIPYEGWEPAIVNEVHTDCLGGRHCDTAVQLSEERLLLDHALTTNERLAVMHPEPAPGETDWVWKGADHWIGIANVTEDDGRDYTRIRNADEIQYQVSGTRLLISANGVVEMTPGTFVHIPVGVAYASIVSGPSTHIRTLSRHKMESVWEGAGESEKWSYQQVEAYRAELFD